MSAPDSIGLSVESQPPKRWMDALSSNRQMPLLPRLALERLQSECGPFSESLQQAVFFCLHFEKMGHTCLPLDLSPAQWARLTEIDPAHLADAPLDKKALENEVDQLTRESKPFPFQIASDRLVLHRLAWMEKGIASRLGNMATASDSIGPQSAQRFRAVLSDFKASAESNEPEAALLAASLLLDRNILLLTGGPGTGKTTAIAGILISYMLSSENPVRVAFTAPTGKAASRLTESLRDRLPFWIERLRNTSINRAGQAETLLSGLNLNAMTLHRLINKTQEKGLLPPSRKQFLAYDLVIVDEASMMDVDLFHSLLSQLDNSTRLILVGDPNQLGSVDAGAVLRDLSRKKEQVFSAETAKKLTALHECEIQTASEIDPLADSHILLSKSHRFEQGGGIGRLASWIVSSSDEDSTFEKTSFLSLMDPSNLGNTHTEHGSADHPTSTKDVSEPELFHKSLSEGYPAQSDPFSTHLEAKIRECQRRPEEEWLNFWRREIWLTPLRNGPFGSIAMNERVLSRFRSRGTFPPACPVIVTKNNYSLGIFNGDIGVCALRNGRAMVAFEAADSMTAKKLKTQYAQETSQSVVAGLRYLPLSSLSEIEPALFLTVHKSQGSEFENVNLILPPEDSPIIDRSLLFTALTRAKKTFTLHGDVDRFLSLARVDRLRFTMLSKELDRMYQV